MPAIGDARILIMATDGFEESELFGPRQILMEKGAEVRLASPSLTPIQATVHDDPGKTIRPDLTLADVKLEDYDALLLPGGVRNPDALRADQAAVALIKAFADAGKPVAAICHGPQLLISANALRGRTLTCWPSIAIDVKNAGGLYVDKPVVEDGNLITSRKPDDVPVFSDAIIRALSRVPTP